METGEELDTPITSENITFLESHRNDLATGIASVDISKIESGVIVLKTTNPDGETTAQEITNKDEQAYLMGMIGELKSNTPISPSVITDESKRTYGERLTKAKKGAKETRQKKAKDFAKSIAGAVKDTAETKGTKLIDNLAKTPLAERRKNYKNRLQNQVDAALDKLEKK